MLIGVGGAALLMLLLVGVLGGGDPSDRTQESASEQTANEKADCYSGEKVSEQCDCLTAVLEDVEHAELFARYRDLSEEKGAEDAYFEFSPLEQLQILDTLEESSGMCPPTAE